MSFSSWPSLEVISQQLLKEAGGDALRLGHSLVGWVPRNGAYYSRCATCLEAAVVRPRSQTGGRLGGPGLYFRCAGRVNK